MAAACPRPALVSNLITINNGAAFEMSFSGGSTVSANDGFSLNGTATILIPSATHTIPGPISGTGVLTKTGAGTLAITSGTNAYSGGTTINAGTLNVNSNAALGTAPISPATNITFSGNSTLQFAANLTSTPLNANRSMVINSGVTGTLDTQGFTINYGGAISGAGGLTKIGSGILTLSGASSYSGATAVAAGTLALTSTASLGNTAISLSNSNAILSVHPGAGTVNLGSTGTGSAAHRSA